MGAGFEEEGIIRHPRLGTQNSPSRLENPGPWTLQLDILLGQDWSVRCIQRVTSSLPIAPNKALVNSGCAVPQL